MQKKVTITQKHLNLKQILPVLNAESEPASDHKFPQTWCSKPPSGGEYYCHGIDLRSIASSSPPSSSSMLEKLGVSGLEPETRTGSESAVELSGLRSDIPTILLSECCLCYLTASEASRVISFFTSQIGNISIIIYEPIQPNDPFGQMMVSNLRQRQIHMPTLQTYPTGKHQQDRLKAAGFEEASWKTVEGIWDTWVEKREKERVDALEGLDEVEEWKLLAAHYIVVWGWRGQGFQSWGKVGANSKDENSEEDL